MGSPSLDSSFHGFANSHVENKLAIWSLVDRVHCAFHGFCARGIEHLSQLYETKVDYRRSLCRFTASSLPRTAKSRYRERSPNDVEYFPQMHARSGLLPVKTAFLISSRFSAAQCSFFNRAAASLEFCFSTAPSWLWSRWRASRCAVWISTTSLLGFEFCFFRRTGTALVWVDSFGTACFLAGALVITVLLSTLWSESSRRIRFALVLAGL